MVGSTELAALQLRKRALILESDLNRLTLALEARHLRSAAPRLCRRSRICSQFGPWLLVVSMVAGVWATKSPGRPRSRFRRLRVILRWLQPLWLLLQQVLKARASGSSEA